MKTRVVSLLIAAASGLLLPHAARADEAGDAAKAALVKTYAGLTTYSSTTHFELRQKQGGWLSTQSGDLHLALDRKEGKVKFEKPDLLLVDDGAKVRVKSDQIAARFLEMDAPKPVAYQTLTEAVPFVSRPPTIEMALLLAPDPLNEIHNHAAIDSVKVLTPDPADPLKRPGLESTSSFGKVTMRMDPVTGLVTSAVIQITVQDATAGESVSLHYDIQPQKPGQGVEPAQFAFDAKDLKASNTLEAWMGKEPEGGAGAGEQAPEPAEALVDKKAPPFDLKTLDGKGYSLADDKSGVIVLDFWATWCGPCVAWLPHLEALQDWAKKENKPVAFYAVDEQEGAEKVKAFAQENKLALAVLMDTTGTAGEAYKVTGLPTTVVISKGVVRKVHVGMNPAGEAILKKQIEEILAAPAAPAAVPPAPSIAPK